MEYTIGDKKYVQTPLVLGQLRQIQGVVLNLRIPKDFNIPWLISALGDDLPKVLAVVLNPEGIPLREKNIEEIAADLEFGITPEMTLQVIEDFFICNPISSLIEKAAGVIKEIKGRVQTAQTGLNSLSVSSPEGTSPGGTLSSGDSPAPSAPPT